MAAVSILDLPEDVLNLIFAHLQPHSFLNFCSTCKGAREAFRIDPLYWRTVTSHSFRLPISPLLQADGPRWFWLYKKLKTQTRLYTWGQGVKGNLGPASGRAAHQLPRGPLRGLHRPVPRPVFSHYRTTSQWPTETHLPDDIGIIVDLQCGGWSTTILNSDGKLFTVGRLDATNQVHVGESAADFTRLEYLQQSTAALRSFSAGRSHVLALDENAEILSWDRVGAKGYKVFSSTGRDFGGPPRYVVAGWGDSSCYVPEVGIIYWKPVKNDRNDDMLDGVHVQAKVVPGTAQTSTRSPEGEVVRAVLTHIVLDCHIVYITSESKVFALAIDAAEGAEPYEVPGYAAHGRELKDLQGQFRNFAVFTAQGDVLAGTTDYLRRCAAQPAATAVAARPPDVPALQNTGVIEVAFGDYHYHALHANGTITSYGADPQACGALGLGDANAGLQLRGARPRPMSRDLNLEPIANLRGRQVWFEPEKKEWLAWLWDSIQAFTRHLPVANEVTRAPDISWTRTPFHSVTFSEWVEQEGRHWADGPSHTSSLPLSQLSMEDRQRSSKQGPEYHDLGAYFAISVAAAGWHSGALVLVDEEKAEQTRAKWMVTTDATPKPVPGAFSSDPEVETEEHLAWTGEAAPRVALPIGVDTREDGPIRPWRDGMPTLAELGLIGDPPRGNGP